MMHDMTLSGYSLGLSGSTKPLFEFRPRITAKRIQEEVAAFYGLNPIHMTGPSQCHHHAHPRQVAMFLCREVLGRSTPDIGRRFGDRDHTTVLHALSAVRKRMVHNENLVEEVAMLKARLRG